MSEFIMSPPLPADEPEANHFVGYASFWKRTGAYFIDLLVFSIPAMIIVIMMILLLGKVEGGPVFIALTYLLIFPSHWLYFAIMESSERGATVGKKAMGLRVTDELGNQITFARASGRYFGKILSSLILYIGYIMIAFTEQKQGLHDVMAGTLVLDMQDAHGNVPSILAGQAVKF